MTFRGRVENGQVVLEPGARFPEGALVEVRPVSPEIDPADGLADEAVSTGIRDLASQHDHYPGISFEREQETPEAKARWFQSLSMEERMELLCEYTDLILAAQPRIADLKDAEQTSDRIRILACPRC